MKGGSAQECNIYMEMERSCKLNDDDDDDDNAEDTGECV